MASFSGNLKQLIDSEMQFINFRESKSQKNTITPWKVKLAKIKYIL